MPYKLSATLLSHSLDVRSVASPTDNLVLSASRDSSAIAWTRSDTSPSFAPSSVFKAGTRYVNSVTFIPPLPEAPQGYLAAGGQDTAINVFSLGSGNKDDPEFSLVGHTDNVCALDAAPSGNTLISGSWDQVAKVWKNFQLAYDLKGHQQSVWAVLLLEDEHFLTGSADKTVKLWNRHKNIHTFRGHNDAVRSLTFIPDIGFASCSNDSEIRVWTLGGDSIYTLSGHTSFVYSMAALPNGDIVSGGEDRTVRVWQDGECVQTIMHPALSVWAVSTMPNGDIVSGCSDGVVRVFSQAKERWANDEDLKEYDDMVARQALPAHQIGDVKKTDLPGLEALAIPGKKPGEVKMVRNGDVVEAHQWDNVTSNWQKVGDVVDAVGQGRRQSYEGKEYDYVFDVDIAEGAPPLKLPYNVTENPYSAAQRFLERNDLPMSYLDQVVQFIEKNTAGVTLGVNNDFVDPFTGGSRYRAAANSAPPAQPASGDVYSDPFTGASRYSATPQPDSNSVVPLPVSNIIPMSKFLHFKQATVSAMHAKLYQFDDAFRNEISTYSLALYPMELSLLDETFSYLSQAVTAPNPPPCAIGSGHMETIIQVLDRWPESQLFPLIDLSRLVVGYCPNVFTVPGLRERFFEVLFKAADWTFPWTTPLPKLRETNTLLLLRTIANTFQDGAPISDGTWAKQALVALNQAPYPSLTKTQRVALATVVLNFSCVNLTIQVEPAVRSHHLTLILNVLKNEKTDPESAYRALIALGNAAYSSKATGQTIDNELISQARPVLQTITAAFPEERVRNASKEISQFLQ